MEVLPIVLLSVIEFLQESLVLVVQISMQDSGDGTA